MLERSLLLILVSRIGQKAKKVSVRIHAFYTELKRILLDLPFFHQKIHKILFHSKVPFGTPLLVPTTSMHRQEPLSLPFLQVEEWRQLWQSG